MSEYQVRITIGFYVIARQVGLIILATVYLVKGGFLFPQYTTLLGMIIPLFAVYFSIIVRFFSSQKYVENMQRYQKRIAVPFVMLSFGLPTLLTLAVGFCIYAAACNLVFRNFDDVKVAIGLAQSVFGIYAGAFIYSLFDEASGMPTLSKRSQTG